MSQKSSSKIKSQMAYDIGKREYGLVYRNDIVLMREIAAIDQNEEIDFPKKTTETDINFVSFDFLLSKERRYPFYCDVIDESNAFLLKESLESEANKIDTISPAIVNGKFGLVFPKKRKVLQALELYGLEDEVRK